MPQTNTGFNLSKATKIGRVLVKYGAITLVVLMVGRVALQAFAAYWRATHPPEPPPPTQGFGKLPQIEFPESPAEAQPTAYRLETASGGLPSFGDRAVVLLVIQNRPSLLDTDQAHNVAKQYNFRGEPDRLSNNRLRWIKQQPLVTVLDLDIVTHNFEYNTDFLSRPELILEADVPSSFDAVSKVKTFLSSGNLLPADIATASGEISYLKAVGGQLEDAVSISDADFVQVDLHRAPLYNAYPMVSPDAETGVIHAVLSSGVRSDNGVVKLIRSYWPVNYDLPHTYPLRTAAEAWNLLQSGEGYVARSSTEGTAVIRTVRLGYFEPLTAQDYLQPVYIFSGDDDFVGYVPAVSSSSVLSVQ